MKATILTFLLLLSCSTFSLFAQTNIKGKIYSSSNGYRITWEKPQLMRIYDRSAQLIGSYSLNEISKPKKRMKSIRWGTPEQVFAAIPRTGFSSVFENDNHLIFTFSKTIEDEQYLTLLFFDKTEQTFKEQTIQYFPYFKPGFKTVNNQFILGQLLFLVHSSPSMIHWTIRPLYDPETILKEYTYSENKATAQINSGLSIDYREPDIPGFSVTDEPAFYEDKKVIKKRTKLIRKANTWGVQLQANPINDQYIEITVGAHYFPNNGEFSIEKLFYFKTVIDSQTYDHVNNQQLKEAGLSLFNIFKEEQPEKRIF